VRHNRIHHNGPDGDEYHPRREPGPVGDGAADQRRSDDREAELESGIQQFGNRTVRGTRVDTGHPEMRQIADEPARAVAGERQRVADQQPGDGHQWDRDEAHHDHVQHTGGADHAAVEDGQPGRHQEDQGGAGE
jgi:hypothetical protein